jgi:hypothetical protein
MKGALSMWDFLLPQQLIEFPKRIDEWHAQYTRNYDDQFLKSIQVQRDETKNN